VLVAAAFAISACQPTPTGGPSPAPSPTGVARTGGTFIYGQSGDAAALDPWNVTDGNSLQVTEQIFESLVTYKPQSFEIEPNLATKWEVSTDKKSWVFTLREGVKFHDGTDFDADAVVFNFERARDTKHPYRPSKPVADNFAYYGDMWAGFDADSVITKVEAVDKRTVRFTTSVPFGPLLANMGMGTFGLISPKSIRDNQDGWMLPGSMGAAGTGAFMFKPGAWQKDQQITLERNPNYWRKDAQGAQLPHLDKLVIRFITDTQARLAELKAGTIHAMRDFTPADIPAITADPNLQLIDRPSFNVGYLGLNIKKPPLDKLEVRKAIAHAIDKQAIATTIYAGKAKPATQFLVQGVIGYDESIKDFYPYNPDEAKRLLQQAGVANPEIDLWWMPVSRPYFPEPKRIAEAFASDLARVGIKAQLQTIDWTTYRTQARTNVFDTWLLGWTGDNGDPDNWVCVFFCNMKENGSWDTPKGTQAVQLMKDAASETDNTKRAELYKQVTKLIQEDVPRIPMFNAQVPVAASKKVSGYVPHPKGSEELYPIKVSQ
jgi:peptide/nickel transport system substrate-binding protein